MEPSREQLEHLARLISRTADLELDCGAILDRVATLLERSRDGAPLDPELEQVKQHLSVCPECLEEYEALEELVQRGELELGD